MYLTLYNSMYYTWCSAKTRKSSTMKMLVRIWQMAEIVIFKVFLHIPELHLKKEYRKLLIFASEVISATCNFHDLHKFFVGS